MVQEVFDCFDRDREPQSFTKRNLHVGDSDDLAAEIEQRASAVAGIDLGRGLEIQFTLHWTSLGADDAFGHRAFQTERTADGKNSLAYRQRIGVAQERFRKFRRVFVFDFQ